MVSDSRRNVCVAEMVTALRLNLWRGGSDSVYINLKGWRKKVSANDREIVEEEQEGSVIIYIDFIFKV